MPKVCACMCMCSCVLGGGGGGGGGALSREYDLLSCLLHTHSDHSEPPRCV